MLTRFVASVLAILAICFFSAAHAEEKAVPASAAAVQLSFAPLVKQVAPAVVNIYTKRVVTRSVANPFTNDPLFAPFFDQGFGGLTRRQVERSLGSGVIVDPDGLIITNAHVVADATEIMVVLTDGREFESTLMLADRPSDIALLRAKTTEKLPFARLQPSENLEVGDLVIAIGNPFGVGQTVTSGIVSALGRSSLAINDYSYFIQTDAAINPGNSGGPLVDMAGGVIGINSAIFSRSGGSLGIGFAIPSEMVTSVISAARDGRETSRGTVVRAWMGAHSQDVTAEIASSLNLPRPQGTLLARLHPKSPLAAAGLVVGDVITAINGKAVRDSAEMKYRTATAAVGSSLDVTFISKGKTKTAHITMVPPPDDPPRNKKTLAKATPLVGITVMNLNPAVAAELSLEGNMEEGVVVAAVNPRAPAARFLSPGDIIAEINGLRIEGTQDVERAATRSDSRGFSITFTRSGQTRTLVIR